MFSHTIQTFEILVIFIIAFHIYYLADILRSSFKEPINKIVWAIVIILLPILGCCLYIFIGKRQRLM